MVNAPSGGEVCVWICSPEKIDWNVVRAETLDCLNAVFELQTWAERSQQEDYDVDSATLHLAVIEKAFETSLGSLRMLFMGMDFDTSVPLRQFPIFDQLALASTGDNGRPDFEIAATAHEAVFTLLMLALIHIKNNLEDDLAINDLQGFSPKKRRDTLCQLEKKAPLMNLLGGSARLRNLKAWINREWAAVSAIQRQTGSKANTAQGIDVESIAALARCLQTIVGEPMASLNLVNNESQFLKITLGDRKASRIENGKTLIASFGGKGKPWELFRELYHAGENGLSRDDINKKLWPDQPVTENALDQHKATANEILETIRVEIKPDNRGVWRLAELNS